MKLLVFTQKIDKDDSVLGFFCGWLDELSKHFEEINVICLEKGIYQNPSNVNVFSLGKEKKTGKLGYIKNLFYFLWKLRGKYDKVFVHMNPEYIVLCGWLWKLTGKKIFLWYTHRQVDLKLRIAKKFSNIIFTSAKESFNIKSKKVKIMGHGIKVSSFRKPEGFKPHEKFTIISVGRITPIKNLDILIEASEILKNSNFDFEVLIVGAPAKESDASYLKKMEEMVSSKNLQNTVKFAGNVPNSSIREYYWQSDISVNLSPTGGIDKAVLESMASGLPVLASNKAFGDYFGDYAGELLFPERNSRELAEKILSLRNSGNLEKIGGYLQKKAAFSDVSSLISKISYEIKKSY